MKTNHVLKSILLGLVLLGSQRINAAEIIVKPGDDIAGKILEANEGDIVRIEEGVYQLNEVLKTTKNITVVGMPFENSKDTAMIDKVVLKLNKSIKNNWEIKAGITIRGIKFLDGDHQIQLGGECNISYCHFENGIDQVSFDKRGYGEVSYCSFYNAGDDGIDIDSKATAKGAYINVHHNYINETDQDGIEFRTHARDGGDILVYRFYDNFFFHCGIGKDGGDAIQIIDQDMEEDSREILVYNNYVNGDNVTYNGISCNDNRNSNAAKNPKGAISMKEKIWIYNNTIANVKNGGIAGSNNTWVFNNIIMNTTKGIVHCTANNNLTYGVNSNTEEVLEQGVNHYNKDPQLKDKTFDFKPRSYCIGRGISSYDGGGKTIIVEGKGGVSNVGASSN